MPQQAAMVIYQPIVTKSLHLGLWLSGPSGANSPVMQRNQSAPPFGCPIIVGASTPIPYRATAGTPQAPPRPPDRRQTEPRLTLQEMVILLVVTTAVLGPAIVFSPVGTFFGSIITPLVRHHQLKTRSDSLEIGRLMVAMLENTEINRAEIIPSSDPRMPARLRELGGVCLSLDPVQGFADLSCGGRSYHFGYTVSVAGDRQTAQYQMTCYGERVDDLVALGVIKPDPSREQIAQRSGRDGEDGF